MKMTPTIAIPTNGTGLFSARAARTPIVSDPTRMTIETTFSRGTRTAESCPRPKVII